MKKKTLVVGIQYTNSIQNKFQHHMDLTKRDDFCDTTQKSNSLLYPELHIRTFLYIIYYVILNENISSPDKIQIQ